MMNLTDNHWTPIHVTHLSAGRPARYQHVSSQKHDLFDLSVVPAYRLLLDQGTSLGFLPMMTGPPLWQLSL